VKLTPEILRTGSITLQQGYLGFLKEAHGCAGTTNSYIVLLPEAKTIAELGTLHEKVEHVAWEEKMQIDEKITKQAGPKPIWDSIFTGTRKEWKEAVSEWEKRPSKHAFLSKNWESLGAVCLQAQGQYGYLNEEWFTTEDMGIKPLLWVLSSSIDNGCLCGHIGWGVLNEEDILADADQTFSDLDRTITPPATLITIDSTWNFIVNEHIENASTVLEQLADIWEQKQNQYNSEVAKLRTIRDSVTYHKLEDSLTFSQWEQYASTNETLDQSIKQLRQVISGPGPLDLAAEELPIWLCEKTTRSPSNGLFTQTHSLGKDFTKDQTVSKNRSQVAVLGRDTGEGL